MPVNSFDHYPMSFKPDREKLTVPIYLSLAKELESRILDGSLAPNTLLPPQRELADFLDINLGTVTRAFKHCQLKGLIYGITGKGTFVSPNKCAKEMDSAQTVFHSNHQLIELGIMKPFYCLNSLILSHARNVLERPDAADLFRYGIPSGNPRHIQAAFSWFNKFSLFPSSEQLSFTNGAQNALSIILASLFVSGDKIAVDEYTYPSFVGIANLFNIQLIAVKNDDLGMIPDELDKVCQLSNVKGIYLMPSCSNPTAISMPMDRRYALSGIIKNNNLLLIEDEAYSFIAPVDFLPFASILPEQTVHISGLSKALSAGLRVAFLMYPEKFRPTIISATYNMNLNTSLLNLEIISELILSGSYNEIIEKRIALSQKRNSLFNRYFEPYSKHSNPYSLFQCIKLPKNKKSKFYEIEARKHGVKVLSSDRFLVADIADKPFLRLSICSPDSEEELEIALQRLSALLR